MRASSLSNSRVVELLERYFVPVRYSVDGYERAKGESASAKEWQRIRDSAKLKGFARGTVCVYVLGATGEVVESLSVEKALERDNLAALLSRSVTALSMKPRSDEVVLKNRVPRSASMNGPAGRGRILHVWSRAEGSDAALGLAHDRIEFRDEELISVLPPQGKVIGDSWQVSPEVTSRMYIYFFPPMKNYDVKTSRIVKLGLTATLNRNAAGEEQVNLEGTLEMDHPQRIAERPASAGQFTNGRVAVKLFGVVAMDAKRRRVTSLRLASSEASYLWHWQGSPVRSRFVLAAELDP